ncbi:sigma-70 family RNA polymerase sigma factor [Niallia sp. NCCP-28]|uniref:sigma-70 family RNA polymerase sigma factor n=1 Tax=Niallia sp. NCCP-28 TaxID=2934712 RepID=UPI00208CAA49|nr:sigma-70 family RNA polymerase sigma factor [Niallia sp. NCCP-28]GKU82199.1 RNA polymerase subunit sigma [Niallia sp. NCCP-28]
MDEIIEAWNFEEADAVFGEIVEKYGQDMLQLTFSYVNNKALAEDLTQDIFVKCYKSLHTYKRNSSLKTWLWRIAINHCKDYLKSWYNKNVVEMQNEGSLTSNGEMVEDVIIQREEEERLVSFVMKLPVKYREVIYLYYFEELTIKEISLIIHVNENTIKTRMKKAKALLKKEWRD